MNKINLENINDPVIKNLELFDTRFKESLKSNVALVDLIARYILRQKGKRIRPLLVLLTAKAVSDISDRTYRGAMLVELLHTATLVHDDVVDNADKRRGFWSLNVVFKNKIAVLMGDYLLARGLSIAVDSGDFDFLSVITNTVKRMSEGELLQIQKTRKLDIDETTYFRIISDKTASLIETCCRIGAMSASDDADIVNAITSYGINLGMAFQIKDDLLDYMGNSSFLGKPVGGDIKEKKITLPLIYAFNNVEPSEVKKIKKLLRSS
ncbi:MAG: polyprenyl synthetase family protein, partial [Bacteroidota bacterium]|nr:polyprenyl synthetase family protein [Bacteroidota bacterium]